MAEEDGDSQSSSLQPFRGCVAGLLALLFTLFNLPFSAAAQESICARVRIEILQELTLERQAFEARMTLNNGLPDGALTDLSVEVNFADRDGRAVRATSNPNDTSALFFFRPQVGGELPGSVPAGGTARATWLIIPAPGAAGSNPQGELYFVGATLNYTAAGQTQKVEVSPDSILVKPMPTLELDYFLPEQVYGDDPFTQDFVEPIVPFPLGVRVRNSGYGVAQKLRIESAQPRIIENELGLLINFQIEGSEVNGLPATPSLLCDFGNIAPNRAGVARWIMTSSLSGQFVEFTAFYSHADELGGELTSLILGTPRTHRFIWDVQVDLPGRDRIRDFLARDGNVLKVYESDNVDTEVADQSANTMVTTGAGSVIIDPQPSAGFIYIQKPDPFNGIKQVKSIVRADGKLLPAANAWFSATWDREGRHWNHFVHVFDANNTAGHAYTIGVENIPEVLNRHPKLDPPSNWTIRAEEYLNFSITATDQDGDSLRFSWEGTVPDGVTLDSVSGQFEWRPTTNQAPSTNVFLVKVTDDGNPPLTDLGSFRIIVIGGEERVPPTLTLSVGDEPLAYVENDEPRILDAGAGVTDQDSANFAGGYLRVEFAEGGLSEDRLAIRNEPSGTTNITLAAQGRVQYGGVEIGIFDGGANGREPLHVALNSSATVAAVERLVRNLTYENVSENPSSAPRTVQLSLNDGDGQTSTPVTRLITVTPVNDPPVARPDVAATTRNNPVSIVAIKLTANDYDVDSTSFALDVPVNASAQGGSVEFAGGVVTYRPPPLFLGEDVFQYRLRDSHGGEAFGSVTVTVRSPAGNPIRIVSITVLANGSVHLVATGTPGMIYSVQGSEDLVAWSGREALTADGGGLFEFTDAEVSRLERRFYRIVETP